MNKLSIVVPVYNVEEYLEKCIESILNQSFKNFELILINDGSTDKSSLICDKFAEEYDNVVVIHQKNLGVSEARNTGLDIVNGDYITFVDSDDWIDEKLYFTLIDIIERNDLDLIEFGYCCVSNEEVINVVSDGDGCGDNILALERLLDGKSSNVLWNKIYKKNLFDGLRFPKDRIYEDGYLMYKLFFRCNKYMFTDIKGYYHLKRDNSIMELQKKYSIKNLDGLYVKQERYEFLKDNICNKKIIHKAELTYFTEIIYHYKQLLMNSNIDREKVYRNNLIKLLKMDNDFLKNPYIKASKLTILASKMNYGLFECVFKFFYKVKLK